MKVFHFLGTGVGHQDQNIPCQDRIGSFYLEDKNRYIFAIADGCSSSKYAAEAAQKNIDVIERIFCKLSIAELSRESLIGIFPDLKKDLSPLEDDDLISCFRVIFRHELLKLRAELGLESLENSDVSATVLFVICEKEKTCLGHIGDGNIIFYDESGNTVYRSEQQNGEDSRHTYFTISERFNDHFQYDIIETESYKSLTLFSDGMQNMFRMETGDISVGAYQLVVEPILQGKIVEEEEMGRLLQEPLSYAMHYGFDDWSIITAIRSE